MMKSDTSTIQLFRWPGRKGWLAPYVHQRFGGVRCYVEPFAGAAGCLLALPRFPGRLEVISDIDGALVNMLRAVKYAPREIFEHVLLCNSEVELCAHSKRLFEAREWLVQKLKDDVEYYNVELAASFLYCVSSLPIENPSGEMRRKAKPIGMFGAAFRLGYKRFNPEEIIRVAEDVSRRLEFVTILCSDWRETLEYALRRARKKDWTLGAMLDPPYPQAMRGTGKLYMVAEDDVWGEAYKWCREHEDDPMLRIALCGVPDQLVPPRWDVVERETRGWGVKHEGCVDRVIFSPTCAIPAPITPSLFEDVEESEGDDV